MGKQIQVGPVIQAPIAGPIVSQPVAGTPVLRAYTMTFVRLAWNSPWFPVDYLRPVSASERAMPGASEATFVYNFGDIKREDENAARVFAQLRYSDFYVCVVVVPDLAGSLPYPIWCGICPAASRSVQGTREPTPGVFVESGDQTFHAFGLDYLLRRRRISGAWIKDSSGGAAIDARKMAWAPPFNQRVQGGLESVQGNRSAARVTRTVPSPAVVGSYAFGGTSLWSARDIIDYLLFFAIDPVRGYDKREPEFVLAGQPPSLLSGFLSSFHPIIDQEDVDIWTLLGRILDRRRGMAAGLTWGVQAVDGFLLPSSGPVELLAFTLTDQDIVVAGSTLPANPNVVDVQTDRDIDYEDVSIEQDSVSTYDQVVVKGERCIAAITASFGDSDYIALDSAWEPSAESAYEAANDDNRRNQDVFARVYRAFKLPSPFGWTDKAGLTLNPGFTPDGEPIWVGLTPVGAVQRNEPTLLAELPFNRLSEDAAVFTSPLLTKPFALCWAENDSEDAADRYIYAEDPPDSVDVTAASLRVRDRESMLELDFRPNHLHAKDTFSAGPSVPAEREPVFDYRDTLFTIAILCDSRPTVTVDIQTPPASMQQRILTIEVPEAHFWFRGFPTIRGLNSAGGLVHVVGTSGDGRVLRNDVPRLRAIAAAARAWYGRSRARLMFTRRRIEDAYPIGTYVAMAQSQASGTRINSCVTERRWQFERQSTQISTEFAELDLR